MKRAARFLVLAAMFLMVSSVSAATVADYDLSWWTVDGGGTTNSSGGSYTLGSTIGQPDASVWQGGEYTLAGGFWGSGAAAAAKQRIYLPLVLR